MANVKLGLRQNWKQFSLLVLINGFVGGMVGLERTILPQIAEVDFGIASKTSILSFILVFGVVKSISNYYAGAWSDKVGRKWLLVIGWLFALPVAPILMVANSWNLIVLANVLLGVNQGLAWSSTVIMKIDLVGEKNRGLAMGFNESAGYASVALVAFATGWIAGEFGLRPYPFYLGIAISAVGFIASLLFVRDTEHHVSKASESSDVPLLNRIFSDTSWRHPNLGSITQAGLVNNLNDGLIWGLLPIILVDQGFSLSQTGLIVGIYPAVWGLGQAVTGKMADHLPKKQILFWGMLLQGLVLLGMSLTPGYALLIILSTLLGVGTAVVYPTFLAAVADNTHPSQRARSIGIFRLWRDMGYAFGALITGILADSFGSYFAVGGIGLLTCFSAAIIMVRMHK